MNPINKSRVHYSLSKSSCFLQHISEDFFLLLGKRRGEPDVDANNKISSLAWLLASRHAEIWESFFPSWLRRSAVTNGHLLAVDCLHCSAPAGESFLQIQVYGMLDVVAIALEERMCLL